MGLSRAEFLGMKQVPPLVVDVPECGGSVNVKVMNGLEREKWERAYQNANFDIRANLIALTLVDDSGSPLFTESDIPAINALNYNVLMRLHDAALEHNKLSQADVDELAGN